MKELDAFLPSLILSPFLFLLFGMRVDGGRPLNSADSCQLITTEVEWEECTANYFVGCFDMFSHTHYAMLLGVGGEGGGRRVEEGCWRGLFGK